jgi:hypothetical protein
MASTRLGADIGSTFTDLVAISEGELVTAKVPSTPQDQDVLQILLVIWYQGGPSPSLVSRSLPSQRNPLHFYPDRHFVRFKQLICKSSHDFFT